MAASGVPELTNIGFWKDFYPKQRTCHEDQFFVNYISYEILQDNFIRYFTF